MTMAAGAVGAAIGGVTNRRGPRLAAPGAIIMTAGLLILWWGLGIFRGETRGSGGGRSAFPGSSTPLGQFDPTNPGGTPGTPSSMNGGELVRTLRAAGFHGDSLVTAVAVAKAESGWRPAVLGDVELQDDKWGPSVGLFQIRSLLQETGTGRPRDYSNLMDPAFNARAAFAISQGGTNWRAWSAYTNGAYRQFLAQARELVAAS